jgi:hypothetical protein
VNFIYVHAGVEAINHLDDGMNEAV